MKQAPVVAALHIANVFQRQHRHAPAHLNGKGFRSVMEPQVGFNGSFQFRFRYRLEQILNRSDLVAVFQILRTTCEEQNTGTVICHAQLFRKLHAALAVHENVQAKQVKPVAGQQLRFQFLCRGKCSDMMFDFQVGEDFAAQCRRFLPRILLIFADRHCIHRSSPPGDQIDFSTDFIFLQQSRLFGHFKHRRISAQATWSNGD